MKKQTVHELKTDPEVFQSVKNELKRFEIRKNDRNFNVGDILLLRETTYSGEQIKNEMKPLEYTGDSIQCFVDYILHGPIYGLSDEWVIMSITVARDINDGRHR